MEISGEPPKHILVDVGNYSHELHELHTHIKRGFDLLVDERGRVTEEDMVRYIITKSKGRFNPALVVMTLKQFRIGGR